MMIILELPIYPGVFYWITDMWYHIGVAVIRDDSGLRMSEHHIPM